jgi:hypothetical protein
LLLLSASRKLKGSGIIMSSVARKLLDSAVLDRYLI